MVIFLNQATQAKEMFLRKINRTIFFFIFILTFIVSLNIWGINTKKSLQEIVIKGIESLNMWMQCEFDSKNSTYLNKLIKEENVELRKFPKDVLSSFKEKSQEVINELIEHDPKSRKIYDAYEKFRISFKDWANVGDRIYYDL